MQGRRRQCLVRWRILCSWLFFLLSAALQSQYLLQVNFAYLRTKGTRLRAWNLIMIYASWLQIMLIVSVLYIFDWTSIRMTYNFSLLLLRWIWTKWTAEQNYLPELKKEDTCMEFRVYSDLVRSPLTVLQHTVFTGKQLLFGFEGP